MKLKKMLIVISIIIASTFTLMLTTSYAWYSFENASTTFNSVTNSDNVIVSYQSGEYINTTNAVPILANEIDKYSSKNNFNIKVDNNKEDNEIMIKVSLVDVAIDTALKNTNFIIDLYYQGEFLSTTNGTKITTGTDIVLDKVTLTNDLSNQFEIRIYILDNGTDQSSMMNKTFSAKIQIDVVSRLKSELNSYNIPDIYVSSITIDGVASTNLPTNGYYTMTSTCIKGSDLTYEPLSKTITYTSGSYVKDDCSLVFTSSTDYPLLSEMPIGSYVEYTGTNGCDGRSCDGQNANYTSDKDMGYCNFASLKYIVNGWRIAYTTEGNVHLISAGSPECMCTNSDGSSSNSSCSTALTGTDLTAHMNNLDNIALKYCNKKFAYNGQCNANSTWAMDNIDFYNMIGKEISTTSCFDLAGAGTVSCGYTNDLIDNGSYYWLAHYMNNQYESSPLGVYWTGLDRRITDLYEDAIDTSGQTNGLTNKLNGIRPVIKLKSNVIVIGGSGTYKDPFIINVNE